MRTALAALLGVFALASVGCGYVAKKLDALSDDQLAMYAHDAAYELTDHGVKFALDKGSPATVQKDGGIADQALRNIIIPLFSNAPLGTVSASAVDTAFAQLKTTVSGGTLDVLLIVAKSALTQVTLPPNPTDKINPRYHATLLAFFNGMAEGVEKALKIPGPAPAPGASPPPTTPPK
jgi:hypothetical protein